MCSSSSLSGSISNLWRPCSIASYDSRRFCYMFWEPRPLNESSVHKWCVVIRFSHTHTHTHTAGCCQSVTACASAVINSYQMIHNVIMSCDCWALVRYVALPAVDHLLSAVTAYLAVAMSLWTWFLRDWQMFVWFMCIKQSIDGRRKMYLTHDSVHNCHRLGVQYYDVDGETS